jgi:NADH dehydrogenase
VILITGASGFIGGAITARLIERTAIRSLTGHPGKNRFGDRVPSFPYDFDNPAQMTPAFEGVEVFVNSYYVRFPYDGDTFERAVDRSRLLFDAARQARVQKIVHVSVSNASEASDLPYYCNKARIERLVRESGLAYTILRPALVVGDGDILVNNIGFFLRRLPVFTIFGDGSYRVQPITLDAFADVAIEAIGGAYPNETVAVAGPRDLTFLDMVRAVRTAVDSRAAIVPAPAWVALAGLKVAGLMLGDVVLTADEIKGLTREYLYSASPCRRGVDFAEWLSEGRVASELGRRYASELARHFDRSSIRS